MDKEEPRIFVVDDEMSVQESLRIILKDKYKVYTFDGPEEALTKMSLDPALVLTDIRMLSMNGIEFLRKLKKTHPEIEVIMITAYPDFSSSIQALRLGAFDYIVKPFGKDEVLDAANRALQKRDHLMENTRIVQNLRKDIHSNYEGTTRALVLAVDAKDSYTAEHSRRTSKLLMTLGEKIGISSADLTLYKRAAELHDIGKIGIEENILRKQGALTPPEREKMRQHPIIGYQILQPATFLKKGLDIVAYHHESYDGRGYPKGLSGKDIPFSARFFSIIDAYDAMTTERCYRGKLSPTEAIQEILATRGTQFDPELVNLAVPHLKKLEKSGYLYDL